MPSIAPGVEVTDLPNFDDITQYEVAEGVQEQLWANEVTRLLEVVTTPTPLDFRGTADLVVDSKRSYEMLAAMADHAWQAVNIATYDGESILALHVKELCKVDSLKSSRAILDYLCEKEDEDDIVDGSGQAMPRYSREDFFNFVSYCTAVLAQVLCAAADGKSFHLNILANLAKTSTKIQVVSTRLQECSQISIDNGVSDRKIPGPDQHDVRGRQGDDNPMMGKGSGHIDLDFEPLLESMRVMQEDLGPLKSSSKKEEMRRIYFLQCAKSVTSYEICSMVYGTGFERFRTLVYQDNENDVLGTSDTSIVNCARSSFDLLDKTIQHVQGSASTHNLPPATTIDESSGTDNQLRGIVVDSENKSVGTRISWSYAPDGRSSESLQTRQPLMLKSMSHVITVMIPLIMTSPTAVCSISDFITMAIFTQLQGERWKNQIKPRAVGNRGPDEPRSLSKALMRRNNLLSGRHAADIGREASFPLDPGEPTWRAPDDDQKTPERIQRHQLELDHLGNKMKAWIIEEKGVMVHCKLYVSTLMLLCAALVAGGVSIGVAVGDRITGVDPFNITTYCWVLAAFVLLVAKSLRVQNWPWNDFLHGRVLCKSVSELSSVTGVNEQLILAKLIQDESISTLETRGPYNTVFNRRSEDGFSIDRPLSTWTMLLSGLIMIEGNDFIHCPRLLSKEDQEVHGDPNRIRLNKGKVVWMRALGFYGNKHAEFI
ncbi:hypothetical protein ACJZ2D_011825 [Fusarium nematophilum]